jgi:arylsulfatase A-like enzyme
VQRVLALTAALFALLSLQCGGDQAPARPNFLIIVTDDQRYGTVETYMPETQARIFDEGTSFTHAFVTTPLCCPSRASILTGMYAHDHGVHENQDTLTKPTFVNALHGAGYYTGLVGKYLNSYDFREPPRPEFDYWVATHGGGSEYYNWSVNENGTIGRNPFYITKVLQDRARAFLTDATRREKPFMLLFAPSAPHLPAMPAPEDRALYGDLPLYRPPNHNELDVADKPQWLQAKPLLTGLQVRTLDELRLNQLRSLKSVDRAIAALLDLLAEKHELDNTVVFFISDNGHSWGEHRLASKIYAYDFSAHVPFAVRYPSEFAAGAQVDGLVANIDIAPTLYDLADVSPPPGVNGRSLLDLADGTAGWREELLIEAWGQDVHYSAVRTERYLYIETDGDIPEFYDYDVDPFELDNRAADTAQAAIVDDLRRRLDRLLAE